MDIGTDMDNHQVTCKSLATKLLDVEHVGRVEDCATSSRDCGEAARLMLDMEGALLWTLWHHQGGSSHIGQPIRKLLGIGQHDRLTDEQIAQAKAFGGAA